MTQKKVLIAAMHPMLSELLETLVELSGYGAVHADSELTLDEALRRHWPEVALVDCDHPDAFADEFMDRARLHGTRVLIYSPSRSARDLERCTARHGLRWFVVPIELPAFKQLLAAEDRHG